MGELLLEESMVLNLILLMGKQFDEEILDKLGYPKVFIVDPSNHLLSPLDYRTVSHCFHSKNLLLLETK